MFRLSRRAKRPSLAELHEGNPAKVSGSGSLHALHIYFFLSRSFRLPTSLVMSRGCCVVVLYVAWARIKHVCGLGSIIHPLGRASDDATGRRLSSFFFFLSFLGSQFLLFISLAKLTKLLWFLEQKFSGCSLFNDW